MQAMNQTYTKKLGPLTLNLDRQRFAAAGLEELLHTQEKARMEAMVKDLFALKPVNQSEHRAASHWALRRANAQPLPKGEPDHLVDEQIKRALAQQSAVEQFVEAVRNGEFRTPEGTPYRSVVHIGIGGSDLGPRLLDEVFGNISSPDLHPELSLHFLANVDYHEVEKTLQDISPSNTLVIVVSKSFSTKETLLNANHLKHWLAQAGEEYVKKGFVGVTCKPSKAAEFGIPEDQIFSFDETVGGRFSLWGPVSMAIRMKYGNATFREFLSGGTMVDEHMLENPVVDTIPGWLAICDFYNLQQGIESLMLSPYDSRLGLLVPYLQQLWMESLGKGVTNTGKLLNRPGCPVLWGGVGTNGQHAFFQMLHQSLLECAVELMAVVVPDHNQTESHHILLSHLLAQAEAFYNGKLNTDEERNNPEVNYKSCPGKRPVHILLLEKLTPKALGCLLAVWEHRTTLLAALQDINPFDQWGVELGKNIAEQILPCWSSNTRQPEDPVTMHLLHLMK